MLLQLHAVPGWLSEKQLNRKKKDLFADELVPWPGSLFGYLISWCMKALGREEEHADILWGKGKSQAASASGSMHLYWIKVTI